MKAISLFSCGGIGDLALEEQGVDVVLANELSYERAQVFSYNFPKIRMLIGDIWEKKNEIIDETKRLIDGKKLDLVFATPPCQGMSKNGRGKLLNLVRKGERPKIDERNRLVIPTIDIFLSLNADTLIMENVPEMENTLIPKNGDENDLLTIPDYVLFRLGSSFVRSIKIIEFADYGVPQRRQRLISVFTREPRLKAHIEYFGSIFPEPTHSKYDRHKIPWITVRDAISHLPKLDAKFTETARHPSIKYHKVPQLDDSKYFWVSNTLPGKTAFDNQCVNSECKFDGNPTHGSTHDENGINKSNSSTPIYCQKCGVLLPRPWVEENGEYRLMKGYTSAYKRMDYDLPSSALTRNLSYACSDNKLHPEQNRVLSIYEAMILHTLDRYNYDWKRADGNKVSDKLIRELIGESIPPHGLSVLFKHFLNIKRGNFVPNNNALVVQLCFI
jgi:DNA (cytosine-5)-methyltransferase 1